MSRNHSLNSAIRPSIFPTSSGNSRPVFVQSLSPLRAAQHWFEFGFDVIPIVPGTKKTAVKWDPWLARLSPAAIRAYWSRHPDHEVGFIVGDDYIVFDADSLAAVVALNDAENRFGVMPMLVVRTARGEHHHFRKDPGVKGKTASFLAGNDDDRIDVKTGRTMVILPPSTGKFIVKMGGQHA